MARAGFLLLAAVLLAAGIHSAALRGLADANYTVARLALAAGKGKPSVDEIATARMAIDEALRFEPSNPHFVEQSALLRERQAVARGRSDPQARRLLAQSLDEFRTAARMRPGSPYVWASIAVLKLRLRELDAEFAGALGRAARLGPWEPQVQIAIADAGLSAWRQLTPALRTLVIGTLERALLREEPEVRRLAVAHDTITLVCSGAALPPRLAALCVKI
jgi:hypothetical protein